MPSLEQEEQQRLDAEKAVWKARRAAHLAKEKGELLELLEARGFSARRAAYVYDTMELQSMADLQLVSMSAINDELPELSYKEWETLKDVCNAARKQNDLPSLEDEQERMHANAKRKAAWTAICRGGTEGAARTTFSSSANPAANLYLVASAPLGYADLRRPGSLCGAQRVCLLLQYLLGAPITKLFARGVAASLLKKKRFPF